MRAGGDASCRRPSGGLVRRRRPTRRGLAGLRRGPGGVCDGVGGRYDEEEEKGPVGVPVEADVVLGEV